LVWWKNEIGAVQGEESVEGTCRKMKRGDKKIYNTTKCKKVFLNGNDSIENIKHQQILNSFIFWVVIRRKGG
jgi:hypothetical protein